MQHIFRDGSVGYVSDLIWLSARRPSGSVSRLRPNNRGARKASWLLRGWDARWTTGVKTQSMIAFQSAPHYRAFRVRKLFATDLPEYRAHLLRLDEQTRYRRFGTCVRDSLLESYAQSSFRGDALVFGYMEAGLIRGTAEFRPYQDEDGQQHAEVAFSVEDAWQGKGIGSALFEKLLVAARNRRIAELVMHCLPENQAMQKLARHFKAQISLSQSERTGTIVDLTPSPISFALEATDDWRAFASAAVGIHRNVWGRHWPAAAFGQHARERTDKSHRL